jgi:hypothetical protein
MRFSLRVRPGTMNAQVCHSQTGDATTTPTNSPTVIITENESVGVLNETVVSAPAVWSEQLRSPGW